MTWQFTLSGLPVGFNENLISGVNWQYGTDLDEPNIPEPSSLVLLIGIGAFALRGRRLSA